MRKVILILSLLVGVAIGAIALLPELHAVSPSQCNDLSGSLNIQKDGQLNDLWCWVATPSVVLKWFLLPHAEQCELYDLAFRTTTCQLLKDDPSNLTGWKKPHDNPGDAGDAAKNYDAVYGGITVKTYEVKPLDFEKIVKQICPGDGRSGAPFIWAYEDTPVLDHDVVVHGYNRVIDPATGSEQNWLYVHDPACPIPGCQNTYLYEMYSDEDRWVEDVMIVQYSSLSWKLRHWFTLVKSFFLDGCLTCPVDSNGVPNAKG